MSNIGEPMKEYEIDPLVIPVPKREVKEVPAPEIQPEKIEVPLAPEREKVPA